MTRFEPTLIVNELRVLKDGHVVLSESFHDGLNIINRLLKYQPVLMVERDAERTI